MAQRFSNLFRKPTLFPCWMILLLAGLFGVPFLAKLEHPKRLFAFPTFMQDSFSSSNQDDQRSSLWRRTDVGWEYANAVEESLGGRSNGSSPARLSFRSSAPDATSQESSKQVHRCMLPVAIAFFLATLGPWLILNIPNKAAKMISSDVVVLAAN